MPLPSELEGPADDAETRPSNADEPLPEVPLPSEFEGQPDEDLPSKDLFNLEENHELGIKDHNLANYLGSWTCKVKLDWTAKSALNCLITESSDYRAGDTRKRCNVGDCIPESSTILVWISAQRGSQQVLSSFNWTVQKRYSWRSYSKWN